MKQLREAFTWTWSIKNSHKFYVIWIILESLEAEHVNNYEIEKSENKNGRCELFTFLLFFFFAACIWRVYLRSGKFFKNLIRNNCKKKENHRYSVEWLLKTFDTLGAAVWHFLQKLCRYIVANMLYWFSKSHFTSKLSN